MIKHKCLSVIGCSPCNNADVYERDLIKYACEYLQTRNNRTFKPLVCIDAGAHVGLWSLAINALKFDVAPQILAIEPVYDTYQMLEQNCAGTRVSTLRAAVWHKSERLAIQSATISAQAYVQPTDSQYHIAGVRIDDWVNMNISVDFIKLDIEGAEFRALLGAQQVLNRSDHMLICVELAAHHLARYNNKVSDIVTLLHDHGFAPARACDDATIRHLTPTRIGKVFFKKGD